MGRLKTIVFGLAALGLAAAASPASAQRYDWGGWYLGAHGGWAQTNFDWTYPNGNKPNLDDASGALWGLQGGFQHQWGNIVLGAEGGFSGLTNDQASGACPNAAFTCSARLSNIYTAGVRIGWAFNEWLLFANGGYANGRVITRTQNNATTATFDTSAETHSGYYIGGGLEYAFAKNWIFGIEYQRVQLDDVLHRAVPVAATENRLIDVDGIDVIRARLSFKFGRDPAPEPRPLK